MAVLVRELQNGGERDLVIVLRAGDDFALGGGGDARLGPAVLVLAAERVVPGDGGLRRLREVAGSPAGKLPGQIRALPGRALDALQATLERHGDRDVLKLVLVGAGLPGLGGLGVGGVGAEVADGARVVDADAVSGGRVGSDLLLPATALLDTEVDGLVVGDGTVLGNGAGHAQVAVDGILAKEVDIGMAVRVVLGELALEVVHVGGEIDRFARLVGLSVHRELHVLAA